MKYEIGSDLVELVGQRRSVRVGNRVDDHVDPLEVTLVLLLGSNELREAQDVAGARNLVGVLAARDKQDRLHGAGLGLGPVASFHRQLHVHRPDVLSEERAAGVVGGELGECVQLGHHLLGFRGTNRSVPMNDTLPFVFIAFRYSQDVLLWFLPRGLQWGSGLAVSYLKDEVQFPERGIPEGLGVESIPLELG